MTATTSKSANAPSGTVQPCWVLGQIETKRTKWADRLASLIGDDVDARNDTAAAVLLIEAGAGVTWAISYGMGFLLLDQAHIDPGFGQRVAIRVADEDRLNSLTRKTMDSRAKVDRSSIPSGAHLRGFGIGGFGELVTRLVGSATIPGMTVGKAFTLRGADALNAPLARTPEGLLSDLDAVEAALQRQPLKELEVLEQLVAIKRTTKQAVRLDELLIEALRGEGDSHIATAWPHESVNENGTPESFVLKGRGRWVPKPGVPTVDDILAAINQNDPLGSLERVKIQLFSEEGGESPISPDIPLRKWAAFEQELDGRRYFLHDGGWYVMDREYAEHLSKRVQEIFERKWNGPRLPPWPPNEDDKKIDEEAYNKLAGEATGGVVLDRKLIRTRQNRRGFEACDILAPDGSLIHVKNLEDSAPASHLFAQGHNSAYALLSDEEARAKLRARVKDHGGDPDLIKLKPSAVVFGIARRSGKPLSAQSLYSFSQVTLVRTVDDLDSRNIPVYVVSIANDTPQEGQPRLGT